MIARYCRLLGVYALLAVWTTWPLATDLPRSLTIGDESAATVPLFTAWTVGWNATAAKRLGSGYWDAPIFFPESRTLAFSEPIVTSLVVAPVVWMTDNIVLAHNGFLLLLLVLNGLSGYALLALLGCRDVSAAMGGAWLVLLPGVQNELGVLQLVGIFGIVWLPTLLVFLGARPSKWLVLSLGVMFAVTHATCGNYGVFASVLLVLVSPLALVFRTGNWERWLSAFLAASVALVLLAPLLAVQHRVAGQHGLVRKIDLAGRLSAGPADYLLLSRPNPWEPDWLQQRRRESQHRLGVGLALPLFAAVGVVCGLRRPAGRRWTLVMLGTAVAAFFLSFGPNMKVVAWSPYETLWHYFPGVAQVRSPFRLAMFVQAACVLLAGQGLEFLLARLAGAPAGWSRHVFACLLAVCVLVSFYEFAPRTQPLYSTSTIQRETAWVAWLRNNTAADDVLVCLPFPTTAGVREFQQTAEWMYAGYFHQRTIVNGYSGFLPDSYVQARTQLAGFPEPIAIDWLCQQGIRYCAVDQRYAKDLDVQSHAERDRRLVLQFCDDVAMIEIYQVNAPTSGTANSALPRPR